MTRNDSEKIDNYKKAISDLFKELFSSKIIDFSDRVKNEGLIQELVYDF